MCLLKLPYSVREKTILKIMKGQNHAKPLLGLFLIVGMLLVASGCSKSKFLEETTTTNLNEQTVFSDSAYAMSFLSNIYSGAGFSFSPTRFGNGGVDAASSEADIPKVGISATSVGFATGSITPATVSGDAWSNSYKQIRAANQYLEHAVTLPFEVYLQKRTAAEARFLRAWYYFILVKHYGGVPLIGDSIFTDKDRIAANRSSFEECVNYIVSECDAAARDLPVRQQGLEYGRVGAGACLALKARILLYAASPLFNGPNSFNSGITGSLRSIVGYEDFNKNRWKIAADAAKAVIALGNYELYNKTNDVQQFRIKQFFC